MSSGMQLVSLVLIVILLIAVSFPIFVRAEEGTMSPKEECEELMNALLPLAKQLLEKYGEFYPIGGVMRMDGSINPSAVYDGNENPPSQELIDQFKTAFQAEAIEQRIKASAIFYDTFITLPKSSNKTNAICVSLDHKDGYTVDVFFPYTIDKNKKVVFQKIIAQRGAGNIFGLKK